MNHFFRTALKASFCSISRSFVFLPAVVLWVSCTVTVPFQYTPAPIAVKAVIKSDTSYSLDVKDLRSMVEIGRVYSASGATYNTIVPKEYSLAGPVRTGFNEVFKNLGFRWKEAPARYNLVITLKEMLGVVQPGYLTSTSSGRVILNVEVFKGSSITPDFTKMYIGNTSESGIGSGRNAVVKIINLALDKSILAISRDPEFLEYLDKNQ
jgi:uncharacterized lipoprotein YajG